MRKIKASHPLNTCRPSDLVRKQNSKLNSTAHAIHVAVARRHEGIIERLDHVIPDLELAHTRTVEPFQMTLAQATNGLFVTREPITLTGPSSNLELNGNLDMRDERIDAKLLVTLPVTNNLPLAALIVGAPAIGGALFVADKLLGDKVARFASVQYDVKGPLQDPQISFDKPFEKPQ